MFTLNCKGRLLVISEPVVMGIINTTPDSFYAGSRFVSTGAVVEKAGQFLEEGAMILDVGGQSTRPGSSPLTAEKELERVIGPVTALAKAFPSAFISIDTWHAEVAREAIAAGACIVNDVSGGNQGTEMVELLANKQVPYILMHMRGVPATMQHDPQYENVTREVLDFLIKRKNELQAAGIPDVIIDPGFGFGKTIRHNFELLRNLAVFAMLDAPILAGLSRKSTVYRTLGISTEESLNGSTVLNTIALMHGASILRVHDVKEAVEATKLYVAAMNK